MKVDVSLSAPFVTTRFLTRTPPPSILCSFPNALAKQNNKAIRSVSAIITQPAMFYVASLLITSSAGAPVFPPEASLRYLSSSPLHRSQLGKSKLCGRFFSLHTDDSQLSVLIVGALEKMLICS